MSNLAFSLDRVLHLDLSRERAIVIGAVSDRAVEIIPADHKTAEDALFRAFEGSFLLRDGNVDLVDPVIAAAQKSSREELIFLSCDETLKTLTVAQTLSEKLSQNLAPSIVVIGSGSLINLATYAVADLTPAPRLTIIPTNAMSIADVAYGGLGLINGAKKNDTRNFRDPDLIVLSLPIFAAAPMTAQSDGQIEVVKHLIFQDTGNNDAQIRLLLDSHETPQANALFASAAVGLKLNIILRYAIAAGQQSAEFILNFGHAHAHAIEMLSNYQLPHSEAVRFGMAVDCSGTQDALRDLLIRMAPWSVFLRQAVSDLLARNDADFQDAYQKRYISDQGVTCLQPERLAFPYAVKTRHVGISDLRKKIRGVLG